MSSRKKQRLSVRIQNEFAVVALEGMEIWDGADLALLREALTTLIEVDGYRAICVDLSAVKYIPSGFFGMLFEWYEQGLAIRLLSPQKNVENMLWFRMFFLHEADDVFRLSDDCVRNNTPNQQVEYHRRAFMNAVDLEDEEDAEEHIKSVRFGVRTRERIG